MRREIDQCDRFAVPPGDARAGRKVFRGWIRQCDFAPLHHVLQQHGREHFRDGADLEEGVSVHVTVRDDSASLRPDDADDDPNPANVAGAIGVPLLLVFLWRSRARATYAGVFLVVGALELYGTSIGTWRWAHELPGLGIADGNPPSGVASGYVLFDVMALLVAPWLVYVAAGTLKPKRWIFSSGPFRSSIRRRKPIGTISASGASSSRASVT